MSKFGVGDKVVVVYGEFTYEELFVGKVGTIVDDVDNIPYLDFGDRFTEDGVPVYECFHQEQLEFEEIYNSPLYKALQE